MSAAVSFLVGNGHKVVYQKSLPKHGCYNHPVGKIFTGNEHQIMLSAILGDGCLIQANKRSYHRVVWNMGHEQHARHKLSMTGFLGSKYSSMPNPGFGNTWHRVVTSCSPVLTMYAHKYGDSKGLKDDSGIAFEMDEFGWAWYYGDDGHLDKDSQCCFLHTEGKSHDMVLNIQRAFNDFIGMDGASIHKYIGGTKKRPLECLRMKKNATKEFHQRIAKHMAEGMEYKIINNL